MKSIEIIVPVYNEEQTLEEIIRRIETTDYCGLEKKIIFVNDCSNDSSAKILANYKNYKIIHHKKNMGKGAAIWSGIKASSADIIVIQDADLEYNPQDYNKILPLILNGENQVVYGSRFKDKTNNKSFLPLSFLANNFLTLLTNILFGCNLTDMETCYKAFSKDALNGIEIKSTKFEFEVEITAKIRKKGIKIAEVPISYNGRDYTQGKKINAFDGIQAVFALFYYKFFD